MEIVRWDRHPSLRRPILIAAFEGWNDAGDAASTAAAFLAKAWSASTFAWIDAEEFFDFTSARPQVRLTEDLRRVIDWPTNELSAAAVPGSPHDVVLLRGVEPQLRWRTFATAIVEAAASLRVEMVVTLGALVAEVPHTRPVRVTGTTTDATLMERLAMQRSHYEGPTGIVGVLQDALTAVGIPVASLWAAVPHYISQTPSPKAALSLVERTAELMDVGIETTELDLAAAAYDRQVSEVVAADEDASAYVRSLEEVDDDAPGSALSTLEIGSVDLAAEVERYLREHGQA